MKKLFTLLFLVAVGITSMFAQTATDGDYRSAATGNWTTGATWEVRASGTWSAASSAPTSTNNVYIQAGHTITVDGATVSCQDLHITEVKATAPTNVTGVLALGANTVEVSGKIRGYTSGTAAVTGSADGTFYTQTSSGAPATAMITATDGSGKIKFIGNTRTIAASSEWGSGGISPYIAEFALTAGQTGTVSVSFKAKYVEITSGTIVCNIFVVGTFAANTGTLTIKNGATWKTAANGYTANACAVSAGAAGAPSANIRCATVEIQNGGTLELTNTSPSIDATTFTNNGTVIYSGGAQNLLKKSDQDASATTIDSYKNLTISESSANTTKTLTANTSVSGVLNLTGSVRVALSTFDLTIGTGGSITVAAPTTNLIQTASTGRLIQNVASGASPALTFPIATNTNTNRTATLTYTANTTAAGTIAARFVSSDPGSTGLPLSSEQGISISGVSPTGYWAIESSAALGGTYTLNVNASNFKQADGTTTITPLTYVRLIKRPTGSSWASSGSTTSAAPSALSSISVADLSTFSDFGVSHSGGAIMPVELVSFEAKRNYTGSLLTWATASEKDNELFNIERSTNGSDFQTIGQVKGSGTTNVAKDYVFEDKTPAQGVNYYRLQQVDFNGKSSRSMVKSVVFGNTELVVQPTLVQDELRIIVGDESPTTLQIFNIAGQRVLTAQAQGEQRINISSLPAGAYFIQTATGTTRRFVKQ